MTTATKPQLAVHIRWCIRRDMDSVLRIESQSFDFPWTEDDFIKELRNRNVIGMVAEASERVVGFMVYELQKQRLTIHDFAVHEDYRFKGVGRQMVRKLTSKLSHDRRSQVDVMVRESNLDAQLFFRAMGFRCVETLRGLYEETDDDAYRFRYRIDQ